MYSLLLRFSFFVFFHSNFHLHLAHEVDEASATPGMCSRIIPGDNWFKDNKLSSNLHSDASQWQKLDTLIATPVKSEEQCEFRCRHTSGCKVFTYDKAKGLCRVYKKGCTIEKSDDITIHEMYKCQGEVVSATNSNDVSYLFGNPG